ncbi:MAG: GNAT family N-acetyltransferase [Kiloniellaceae bacterium]
MADDIQVRPVARGDHDAWLPLWHAYNVFYGRSWGKGGEPPVAPNITAATWARFFDAGEPLWALVAEGADGALLGFTHYLFHRNTNSVAPVCYLEDLFTVEAARGRGAGRALIEGVAAAAGAAGVTQVYWLTQESNATARRLYDQVAKKSDFLVYFKDL